MHIFQVASCSGEAQSKSTGPAQPHHLSHKSLEVRKDLGGSATVDTGSNINQKSSCPTPTPPPPPGSATGGQERGAEVLVHATKSKPAQQIVHHCKDCLLAFGSITQLKSHVRQV